MHMNHGLDATTMAMAELNFSGNVIPQQWYQTITFENGKPHLPAVVILSEIVYWYRPQEVRNPETGDFVGYKKRFKADKLQRSIPSFMEQFGLSRKQVRGALDRLEELGIIDKEHRSVDGLSNVLYIGLDVSALKLVTYPSALQGQGSVLQGQRSEAGALQGLGSALQGQGLCPTGPTYTEITTENTTKTTTDGGGRSRSADADFAHICTMIESNGFGLLSPVMSDQIQSMMEEYAPSWIDMAITTAVKNNKRTLNYVDGILRNWRRLGTDPLAPKQEELQVGPEICDWIEAPSPFGD